VLDFEALVSLGNESGQGNEPSRAFCGGSSFVSEGPSLGDSLTRIRSSSSVTACDAPCWWRLGWLPFLSCVEQARQTLWWRVRNMILLTTIRIIAQPCCLSRMCGFRNGGVPQTRVQYGS
jgi:hypothetical protein